MDVREYRLANMRNQFAIVLQEPSLFPTTIAENIAYGRRDNLARVRTTFTIARRNSAFDYCDSLLESEGGGRLITLAGRGAAALAPRTGAIV